jgi:hypothetical protein
MAGKSPGEQNDGFVCTAFGRYGTVLTPDSGERFRTTQCELKEPPH